MNKEEFNGTSHLTNRLKISLYTQSDFHDVHDLLSREETDRFNALGIMQNEAQTQAVLDPLTGALEQNPIMTFTFVARSSDTGAFVGLMGMILKRSVYRSADVWYKLPSEHWGQGFATECLDWMLTFAFEELKLHRIAAGCAVDNIGSYKVMEKVGMRREGKALQCLPLKNGWSDTLEYAILETEFEKKNRTDS